MTTDECPPIDGDKFRQCTCDFGGTCRCSLYICAPRAHHNWLSRARQPLHFHLAESCCVYAFRMDAGWCSGLLRTSHCVYVRVRHYSVHVINGINDNRFDEWWIEWLIKWLNFMFKHFVLNNFEIIFVHFPQHQLWMGRIERAMN